MTDPQWMKVSEAAHLLGVSERTIRRWMNEGRLPVDDAGKMKLVDVSGKRQAGQAQRQASGQVTPDTDRHRKEIESLSRRVQRLIRERDGLKGDLGRVTVQRDNLEVRIKEIQERLEEAQEDRDQWRGQAAALTQNQRLLAERTGRRFRWPWEPKGEE